VYRKITLNRAHADIFTFLRGHLELLHIRNPVSRIENQDFRAFYIPLTFKRRLAVSPEWRPECAPFLFHRSFQREVRRCGMI
jgi:hypothetical protein